MKKTTTTVITLALMSSVVLTGCETMTTQQKGVGGGAAIGAIAGQVIGRDSKSTAIGAALGALGGYVWSRQMEDKKRQMEAATAGTGTQVSQTADNQLKLSIPNDISFASGKSDIQPRLKPILDQFAQGVNQQASMEVKIVGHTDNTGSDAINNPLSVRRAESARDYLVSRGVAASRISATADIPVLHDITAVFDISQEAWSKWMDA